LPFASLIDRGSDLRKGSRRHSSCCNAGSLNV
jgi:hypothetical protein